MDTSATAPVTPQLSSLVWLFASDIAGGRAGAQTGDSSSNMTSTRLRVLIIEDNEDAAHTLRDLLTCIGHEVVVTYTGTEGVAAAADFKPHVILCDLGLPQLDGFGVATALKANPHTTNARLIAVTGYNQEEDMRRSKQVGFDLHLIKPVDLDVLEGLLVATEAELNPDKH